MPFTITVIHVGPYLRLAGAGTATLADHCGCIDLAATVCTMTGYKRALLDLTAIDMSLSFTDHLKLGAHAAERLAGLERVASVVSLENRKGSSEKAAQKMGLRLRTFTSLDEGLAWIGEGPVSG